MTTPVTPAVPVTTGTLAVPDGRLHYEVRGTGPAVVIVGAPMDAAPFGPLADLLAADHTVITTDPRGINRSVLDDPEQDSTPELRADDLSRLLGHLDAGPAAAVGSSGGAVTVLALAQTAPERVRTVVAHEPPLAELLDERDRLRDEFDAMVSAYAAGDVRGAVSRFVTCAGMQLPPEMFEAMVSPDRPARMLADERYQFLHMLRGTAGWRPDVDRLRSVPVRVVVGIGETSAGQLCDRTSRALAAALGVAPELFPGGHVGFMEDPAAFAARLRAVLAAG